MIIEISLVIIAIAFAALVAYVIALTKTLRKTLNQISQTLVDVRKQLEEIGPQALKTFEHTNQISDEIKQKIKSLNSLFNTVSTVGDFLEHKIFLLKKEHSHWLWERDPIENEKSSRESIKVSEILEIVDIGTRLWQKLKKRR